jgi:hypothetical protein
MANRPKSVWIIFDPMDGPHLFTSKLKAEKQYKKWEEEAEAENSSIDSFWDMSEPTEYQIKRRTR